MKREDFKEITEEYFNICKIIVREGNCESFSGCSRCPFTYNNNIYGYACSCDNDEAKVESAREFLKFKEVKDMTKSDLRSGMILEDRSGTKQILIDTILGLVSYTINDGWNNLDTWREDLTDVEDDDCFDIIKIYKITEKYQIMPKYWNELELIWERKDENAEIKQNIKELEEKLAELKAKIL